MKAVSITLAGAVATVAIAITVTVLPARGAPLTGADWDNTQTGQFRELLGTVTSKANAPVANAVVYLKNTKTLTVKTFITGGDGKYRFPALAQNVDYVVHAELQGRRSDTRTLSAFDSRPQAYINLKLDTGR